MGGPRRNTNMGQEIWGPASGKKRGIRGDGLVFHCRHKKIKKNVGASRMLDLNTLRERRKVRTSY